MYGNCCSKDGKEKKCFSVIIAKWLLVIGGINWGLVGIGMLLGSMSSWNIVHMIFGGMPWLEGVIYVLVGISAVIMIFGCKCRSCGTGACGTTGEVKQEGTI
ncbi:MAG: DUF378 domain-containing protein [Candidatus Paceibacterota bacterium]